MTDNRNSSQNVCSTGKESICIDTMRVLDSCRDRDCYEDARVYLTEQGQQLLTNCASVRVQRAEILWAYVGVTPVAFNDGFFQVNVRYYIRIFATVCSAPGTQTEFTGLVIIDKSVVLYGGCGNVNIFKSDPDANSVCPTYDSTLVSNNLPTGVVEAVEPIVLSSRVCQVGPCCGCGTPACSLSDLPAIVSAAFPDDLVATDSGNILLLTVGIFSIVRIERPAQYLISASDYTVPDKECKCTSEDPCSLFRSMSFPIGEFCTTCNQLNQTPRYQQQQTNGGCGCK